VPDNAGSQPVISLPMPPGTALVGFCSPAPQRLFRGLRVLDRCNTGNRDIGGDGYGDCSQI
jgi:hypothetical protein